MMLRHDISRHVAVPIISQPPSLGLGRGKGESKKKGMRERN